MATEGLKASSVPFDAVFAAVPGNFLLLDPDLRIVGVSDAYLTATMTRRADILGRALFDIFPDNPEDPAADGVRNLRASLHRVLETRQPDRMAVQKYDIRRPDSEGGGFEVRYWSPLNSPVLDSDGTVRCIIHSVEDVTEVVRLRQDTEREHSLLQEELRNRDSKIEAEAFLRQEAVAAYRKLAESNQRLLESERRYRFLAEAAPQLIWTTDAAGQLDYANERYLAFTGLPLDAHRGEQWLASVHEEDRTEVRDRWREVVSRGNGRFELEFRMRRHDGEFRSMLAVAEPYCDASGVVQTWFGSSTDIHERILAERQLREVQRLQSVGKLAGGMAHEVNNMMSAVLGFGELVVEELGPDHPLRGDIQQMVKAGARAADVTRQLLAFSRQQVLTPAVLDLNTVVEELSGALRRLVGSDRRLDIRKSLRPVRVLADRSQIEQVMINLVSNARDATTTNGVIRIELEHLHGPLPAGVDGVISPEQRFVQLAVRDDGAGIPPDVLARVFEPFFTTKPIGHGTGLGMSMVHGIVKQSGGAIAIESVVGAGTTVSVFLPLVDASVDSIQADQRVAPGGGERILIVEDEPMVRALARRALESAGYIVHHAPNGAAALEFLAAHPGEIDLVLTDVVMPNINGRQLAERIAVLYPQLPVMFMTGYAGEDILQRGLLAPETHFVQKPFTIPALTAAVRATLDERAGT